VQQMAHERVVDGDKDIFCMAVMGSSTCRRVILLCEGQMTNSIAMASIARHISNAS